MKQGQQLVDIWSIFTIQNVPIKFIYPTIYPPFLSDLQYKMFLLNLIFLKLPI